MSKKQKIISILLAILLAILGIFTLFLKLTVEEERLKARESSKTAEPTAYEVVEVKQLKPSLASLMYAAELYLLMSEEEKEFFNTNLGTTTDKEGIEKIALQMDADTNIFNEVKSAIEAIETRKYEENYTNKDAAEYKPDDSYIYNSPSLSGKDTYNTENSGWEYARDDESLQYNAFDNTWEYAKDDESLQYNAFDNTWEYAKDDESLQYNAFDNTWEYAGQDEALQYNAFDNTWEYAGQEESLQYNPFGNSWDYAEPGATLQYNPFDNDWEY